MRALPNLQRSGTCVQRVLRKASLYTPSTQGAVQECVPGQLHAPGGCASALYLVFLSRKGPCRP